MSNTKPHTSSDHREEKALCRDDDSPVPPADESFFATPPDVMFLPESQSTPQPDLTAGSAKNVPEFVEMLSQPQCAASTEVGLSSPVTVGASPAVPFDVDETACGTPGSGAEGGKKGNKKLTTRKKVVTRRSRPPILVSPSPSSRETTPEAQPVEEGGKSPVSPHATPPATKQDEGGGKPTSSTSAPRTAKDGIPSSSVSPPHTSGDGVPAPSPHKQTSGAKSAPFSSQNTKDANWLRQQPIPTSLEELVRLYASRRQRPCNENVLDILASKDITLSR